MWSTVPVAAGVVALQGDGLPRCGAAELFSRPASFAQPRRFSVAPQRTGSSSSARTRVRITTIPDPPTTPFGSLPSDSIDGLMAPPPWSHCTTVPSDPHALQPTHRPASGWQQAQEIQQVVKNGQLAFGRPCVRVFAHSTR